MWRIQQRMSSTAFKHALFCNHTATLARHYSSLGRPTPPLLQAWAQRAVRQWMCLKPECRHVNGSKVAACESCGASKPITVGWACNSCSTKNFKGVKLCKKCAAPPDPSVWACASCNKNNAVDDLDDNSTCGHCGYDMAPLSRTEEEILRLSMEREERHRLSQEQFDSVSARDSDEQTGSETFGFDKSAPPAWAAGTVPGGAASSSPETAAKAKPKIVVETIAPFKPKQALERATSIIGRQRKTFEEKLKAVGPPGHDWMCRGSTCGTINGGDDDACSACAAPFSTSQWECQSCAAVNHETRKECFNCSTAIPPSWLCGSCNAMTSVYDASCRMCTATRAKIDPKTAKDVNMEARAVARGRGRGGAGGGIRPRRADWSCPGCNTLNFASRTRCFKCDMDKPGASATAASPEEGASSWSAAPSVGDGNWICTSCSASNFRTRTECWQCKASAGANQAGWANDDSTPQFEKEGFQGWKETPAPQTTWGGKVVEDWSCSKCFAKNFKGKSECFKCGSPKAAIAAPRSAFTKKSVKI